MSPYVVVDLRLRIKVVKVVQERVWTSEFDLEDELARGICCQGAATIFFSDGSSVTLAWSALGVDKVRFEGSEGESALSCFLQMIIPDVRCAGSGIFSTEKRKQMKLSGFGSSV